MSRYPNIIFILIMTIAFGACGKDVTTVVLPGSDCTDVECGNVRLMVAGSRSFNPNIDHGHIELYRIAITGPGIEGEFSADFPGDATEGVIEGVPAGDDRIVEVKAINPNEVAIREGESEGIKVSGGSTADVDVTMESVPIFTNLSDRSVVENTRLKFHVFSEPPDALMVEDASPSKTSVLVNASTSVPEFSVDVSTGLGSFSPALLVPGTHTFTVKNSVTGRLHSVSVRLLDGSTRKPAPVFSATDLDSGNAFSPRRFGLAVSNSTAIGQPLLGVMPQLVIMSE